MYTFKGSSIHLNCISVTVCRLVLAKKWNYEWPGCQCNEVPSYGVLDVRVICITIKEITGNLR